MTTLRSRIRPNVYALINGTGWLLFYATFGCMLLLVVIATSFFWIPVACKLWFEEKPVVEGVIDWFGNDLLNVRI